MDWRCNRQISILSGIFTKSEREKGTTSSARYSFFGISYFGYNHMVMENDNNIKVLSIPEKCTSDEALGYHLLNTFAEVYERRRNHEIDDIKWQSWKNWMDLAIQHKSMIKIWKDVELQHYFDPMFTKFMNTEIFPLILKR